MGKFKYEKYNYSKIGIKSKLCFEYVDSHYEYDSLRTISSCENMDLVHKLFDELKRAYASSYSVEYRKKNEVSDIDFEWTITTPGEIYKSNETSN